MLDKNIDINLISIDYFIDIVKSSNSLVECYARIGLSLSQKYHNIIVDLWKCRY